MVDCNSGKRNDRLPDLRLRNRHGVLAVNMRNIQPGMNIERQRRKLTHLHDNAPDSHKSYLAYLIAEFDSEIAAGRPTPASEYIPRYEEEFGL